MNATNVMRQAVMRWPAALLFLGMTVLFLARAHAQSTTLPGTLSGTTVSINATSGTATVLGASTLSGTVSFNLQFGVEYLVAGGGGGGGGAAGGGGGAGGVRTNLAGSPLVLGSQSYQTVVGAGGLGGNNANGTAGSSSSFSTVTASGGGLGGGGITNTAANRAGGSGGSGGGGGGSGNDGSGAASGGTGNAGAYTPVEGFGGGTSGNSPASNTRAGGGGGGAGGSGTNAVNNTAGNGGIGLLTTIRGQSEYFGGGGGGGTRASTYSAGTTNVTGTGGLGGGGNGAGAVAGSVNGVAATANTGGGGGGGSFGTTSGSSVGGNGGSGIVIVRYLGSQWASGGAVVAGTGSAAGYTIHTFTSTGTSTFAVPTLSGRLAATVSDNLSGSGAVQFTGPGTLRLSGSNSYSGGTAITGTGSIVSFANTAARPAIGTTTVAAGSGIGLGVGGAGFFSASDIDSLFAGTFAGVSNDAASLVGIDTTDGNFTYSSNVAGTRGLAKLGSNTLTLSGSNSYTGGTQINAGVLSFANNALGSSGTVTVGGGTLQWGSGNTQDISSRLAIGAATLDTNGNNVTLATTFGGSAGGLLTKIGAGTLTLSASNSYIGDTTVSAGTLAAGNAGAFGAQSGGLVAQGGVLDLGNFQFVRTGVVSFAGGTVQSGTLSNSTVAYDGQAGSVSAALAGTAGLTKTTSGTLTLSAPNSYTGTTSINAGTLQVGSGGTAGSIASSTALTGSTGATLVFNRTDNYGGSYANPISGGIGLTQAGSGTLTLSASNSYTGGTRINAGVVSFGTNGLGSSGTVTVSGGTLQWGTGNTRDISGRLALVSGSTATLDTNANNVTLGTGFGGSTTATLAKIGSGTLTLSASNAYSGGTQLNAGGLNYGNVAALGTGTLAFTGNTTLQAGVSGTVSNAMSITSGNTGTFDTQANNATLSGVIGGAGGLTKIGSGTLALSARNTFTGGLTVNAGEVVLSQGGQPGVNNGMANNASNTLTINNGGTVTMTASDVYGWLGSGGGPQIQSPVVINAGGLLRNSGNVVNALGPVTLAGGTLQGVGLSQQWAFGFSTGTVTVNGGANTSTIAGRGIGLGMNSTTATVPTVTFDVVDGAAATDLLVSGTLIDGVAAWPSSKTSSLVKAGAGLMQLTAANTFTGSTSIAAGILDIGAANAIQNTSGVFIANAARLRYSGGTGSVDRAISVTSGTGTVENTGGGTLTLSGTLSKNGTVLRLAGGSFNVTGLITGTSANSDLVVSGTSTVTLSNTNTYNGPTFVNQSSTLVLGTNNAIPNNSLVTLGDATTTGTLNMTEFTNAIGGLSFGAGGGTLRMTASATGPTAQLIAATGTMTLTNGTLDLAGSGSTAGLYRVLSAQTVSGSFASITGTSAAYQVVTTSSSVNYQQRAVLGAVSVTNPAVSIITGGSAAFTYTVANTALSGGADLGFSSGSLSANLAGASSGTAVAGGSSAAISGLLFTGTSIGTNQQGTFTVTAPTAFGETTATGTVAVTVLDHSLPGFQATGITDPYAQTTLNINFGSIDESAGVQSFTYNLLNLASQTYGAGLTAGLDFTGVTANGNGFASGLSTFSNLIGGGTSSLFTMTFTPSGQGTFNKTFTLSFSDQALSGASARRDLTINAQVIVVPEPGAIALAGIGIAAAAWALRRRRT